MKNSNTKTQITTHRHPETGLWSGRLYREGNRAPAVTTNYQFPKPDQAVAHVMLGLTRNERNNTTFPYEGHRYFCEPCQCFYSDTAEACPACGEKAIPF